MGIPETDFPKVSVIVPVYNAQRTITDCIESLLNLNYPRANLEIIVVNNASTDHTAEILNQYNSELKILREQKRGPAAARNRGVIHAMGEVIAFTDSDCMVDREWLKNLVLPLRDDRVGIVGGKILANRLCNEIEKFGELIHDLDAAINKYKPPYVATSNWASKRRILEENNLFDENFFRGEDCDLSFRLFQAGYQFTYAPDAIVFHPNERTLMSLFREGCQHGYWSVKINKRHKELVEKFGHRRINVHSYKELLTSLMNCVKPQDSTYSKCYFTFNMGKKFGKLIASVRFLHLDL